MRTHPVGLLVIEKAGVNPGQYAGMVRNVLAYDSERQPDLLEGRRMARHHSSVLGDRLLMTVSLSDNVHFVTGPDEESSRITLNDVDIPHTLRAAYVGRPVNDLIAHELLDMPGLTISRIEDVVDQATGRAHPMVSLDRMEWVQVPGTGRGSLLGRLVRRLRRAGR